MRDLASLDLSRFDRRELAALVWVRSFLTCPGGVPVEVEDEFRAVFTPGEREHIRAAMKGMFCVNLAVNTHRNLLARFPGGRATKTATCRLGPE